MNFEEYHEFRIGSEHERDAGSPLKANWFNVFEEDKLLFRLRMVVDAAWAATLGLDADPLDAARDLAGDLGKRWVHGLIDLGRYELGRVYEEERAEGWQPLFGELRRSLNFVSRSSALCGGAPS